MHSVFMKCYRLENIYQQNLEDMQLREMFAARIELYSNPEMHTGISVLVNI